MSVSECTSIFTSTRITFFDETSSPNIPRELYLFALNRNCWNNDICDSEDTNLLKGLSSKKQE